MNINEYIPTSVAFGKRTFDIVGSLIGLTLGGCIFPLIGLAIKLDSKGPIIFRQIRVGFAGTGEPVEFWMYKFRTMRTDAEVETGPVWAKKNDPRNTHVGRFLRKARLDEIPQLYNVFRGEMSLIGPRPERPSICDDLEREIPFYIERTYGLRPGITGLAQVYQGYDETIEDVRSKVSYDHAYALSLSWPSSWLAMDLEIIWKTIGVVFTGRGQ